MQNDKKREPCSSSVSHAHILTSPFSRIRTYVRCRTQSLIGGQQRGGDYLGNYFSIFFQGSQMWYSGGWPSSGQPCHHRTCYSCLHTWRVKPRLNGAVTGSVRNVGTAILWDTASFNNDIFFVLVHISVERSRQPLARVVVVDSNLSTCMIVCLFERVTQLTSYLSD